MSRMRWGLGVALALIALIAAASALRTYTGHKLWLGGLSVAVLVAIDLCGFISLARARYRLAIEIDALAAQPPGGSLLAERKQRLEAVFAIAARPDLDALAEATRAAELGRAYLGKYLVAVTVLVGLVGTFAGLMETLRGVAPLLADEHITTLQALARPLAGLDVTFGASLVGILVTLALSLVQGDLALAEEEALARLEERTRHVLVPALWPAAEAAGERTVRELFALRGELNSFLERAAEAAAERVARVAAVEVDRMVRAVRSAVEDSVQGTATRVEAGLLSMASTVEAKLTPVFAAQEQRLAALQASAEHASSQAVEAGAQAAQVIAQAAERTLSGIETAVADLCSAEGRLVREATGALDGIALTSRESVERLEVALRGLGEKQATLCTQLLETQSGEAARLRAVQGEVAGRVEAVVRRLMEDQASHAAELESVQAASAERVQVALQNLVAEHATYTARLEETHTASVQRVESTLTMVAEAQTAQNKELTQAQSEAAARIEGALAKLAEDHTARLTATTTALCESVRASVGAEGLRIEEAAQALRAAAGELGASAQALGGPLSELSPELRALAREVALLAARGQSEEPAVTLDELLRIGEGVERLEALLRMAQGELSIAKKA